MHLSAHTRFPVALLRPLGHLSVGSRANGRLHAARSARRQGSQRASSTTSARQGRAECGFSQQALESRSGAHLPAAARVTFRTRQWQSGLTFSELRSSGRLDWPSTRDPVPRFSASWCRGGRDRPLRDCHRRSSHGLSRARESDDQVRLHLHHQRADGHGFRQGRPCPGCGDPHGLLGWRAVARDCAHPSRGPHGQVPDHIAPGTPWRAPPAPPNA